MPPRLLVCLTLLAGVSLPLRLEAAEPSPGPDARLADASQRRERAERRVEAMRRSPPCMSAEEWRRLCLQLELARAVEAALRPDTLDGTENARREQRVASLYRQQAEQTLAVFRKLHAVRAISADNLRRAERGLEKYTLAEKAHKGRALIDEYLADPPPR